MLSNNARNTKIKGYKIEVLNGYENSVYNSFSELRQVKQPEGTTSHR